MHKNLKKTLKMWHISSCVLVERICILGKMVTISWDFTETVEGGIRGDGCM